MVNPGPVPNSNAITPEQMIAQIKLLTENQTRLQETISDLERKARDPFINFATPDPIKNIPTFNGNRKETLAWVEDTQQTLDLFEDYEDDPTYKQILRVVRSKIVGEAREVLIASGNPKEWGEIKKVLLNSFGDKRDITSHIQSLFYIKQGKATLTEYYHKVKTIDTAIKSSAAQMEDYKHSIEAVNKLISLMSLTRYIDGLNGEQLSMYVRSYRPKTLEEAHDITTQHSNATYRQKMENKQGSMSYRVPDQKSSYNAQPQKNNHFNNPKTNQNNKPGSDKFRVQKVVDDDVSMKTYQSKMQVHNHETHEHDAEHETPTPVNSSLLESDDDEFFEGDELNFHLVAKEKPKI